MKPTRKPFRPKSGPSRFSEPQSYGNAPASAPALHKATCSQCGASCIVPFKPHPGRGVLCDSCFELSSSGKSVTTRRAPKAADATPYNAPLATQGITKKDIDAINRKLDEILRRLDEG